MDNMKKYENIMRRLKECADENNMVCLDAVAEVVNQELDSILLAYTYYDEQYPDNLEEQNPTDIGKIALEDEALWNMGREKTPALNHGSMRMKR